MNRILGNFVQPLITLCPIIMLTGYVYSKFICKSDNAVKRFFADDDHFHFVLYILGSTFALMYYFQFGWEFVYSEKTGGVMIGETLNYTISIVPVAGAVLPLLAGYGLLEAIGAFLEPFMRPLFKVPGKSALDTIASIVGAAVVGIMFTASLYKEKHYTAKEAFFISSSFSLNSVGYCAFLIGYVGLLDNFGLIFLLYCIVTYTVAAIVCRIPPISKYPDVYIDGSVQTPEMRKENLHLNISQIKKGYDDALKKADQAPNLLVDMAKGFWDGCLITAKVIPMVITIGIIGLAISEFTPIIKIISIPFTPFIAMLGIPDASLATQAILVGGIDLFLPSILIAGSAYKATRFFVLMVSLVQVLYITETMLPIIFFGIPAKFKDILYLWVIRTLIAIPIIAVLTHILYI
ncbi:MAG: nucleoside recognition domain-containing protein [Proteocatella sp.]